MGFAYAELKQYDKSIKCYAIALEINPKDSNAYYNIVTAKTALKQYNKAIKCHEKAIEINPEYSSAYYNIGIAY